MSKLTKETIKMLAQLCAIRCTPEEEEALLGDLEKIMAHFELLSEVDTENVEPCSHVLVGMVNVMREDEIGSTMPRKEFLDNSPDHVGGMIKVPPVIQQHVS